MNGHKLTPAKTLVISSTLIPANGKVDGSAGVARHLRCVMASPGKWQVDERLRCRRERWKDMVRGVQ